MASQIEIPGLNNAVQHLEELADRMRCDFGFGENDVSNIDNVIEALKELEAQRLDAHERLETETIRASIQRHKLQFLPQKINKEVTDAVNSARQSNADALAALKKNLEDIQKNIVYLGERQKLLDEENSVLHPERELIRQQHEEIISQLNQRMAEKASMQIQLNETRDKVRQTNQDIVDLEDGILQLKEDLINERTEARAEKRQLKKAVSNTTEKTKEQREVNIEKKKALDKLYEKLLESEGNLDTLRKSLRRYETSKAKLEGQERALNAQLQKQLKQNEELRRKGAAITSEDLKVQREFNENEKQLTNKLSRMEGEIEREGMKLNDLASKRYELNKEFEEKQDVRLSDANRVSDLDEELQNAKRQLALKAEEVGKLQSENISMTEEIETLGESHKVLIAEQRRREEMRSPSPLSPVEYEMTEEEKAALDAMEEEERQAVMAQMNKQIEDYRAQLARERKERLEVQERKNSVSKELEDYKMDTQKFMQEMNNTVQAGKQEHIVLSSERELAEYEDSSETESEEEPEVTGAQLQRELRQEEEELKKMEEQLEEEQRKYQEMFTMLQNKVETTEREIIEMEHSIADKSKLIEDKTPEFLDLEKRFEDRTAAYEKIKKDIVALKGEKMQLEEQIRKSKEQKEKMAGPLEQLQHELKKKRSEVIFQLKHQNEDRQAIEKEIYLAGCKLKTVLEENHRFEDACNQTQADIDDLRKQMEDNEKMKQKLLNELQEIKAELVRSWGEDVDIMEHFSERDQHVVDGLGELLDKTEHREQKISSISDRLNEELVSLSQFLDNLASRRPKGTPVQKKPISFRLSGGIPGLNKDGEPPREPPRKSPRQPRSRSRSKSSRKSKVVWSSDQSTDQPATKQTPDIKE